MHTTTTDKIFEKNDSHYGKSSISISKESFTSINKFFLGRNTGH